MCYYNQYTSTNTVLEPIARKYNQFLETLVKTNIFTCYEDKLITFLEDQSRLIAILPLSPFYATGIVLLVMVAITITAILCRKKPVVIVEYAKVPEIFEDDSYSAKVYYHNPTIIREYDA